MKKVNILTEGPISYNSRAFLQPLILNNSLLSDLLIKVKIYTESHKDICECDLLILDSKFFKNWWVEEKQKIFDTIANFSERTSVIFFDTTDSSGYVLGEVLPYVKSYYKHQILKDKELYLNQMYGRRLFSSYYHETKQILDAKEYEEDAKQVKNPKHLEKIKVGWNTGLANYSYLGEYLGKIYTLLPIKTLLRYPKTFSKPGLNRLEDFQCRFNTSYTKKSVSFQREEISRILADRIQTTKINRFSFFRELRNTKLILSPFGLGEITLKDFEVFITGGLLMKPNMDHLDTWPNFYTRDTYIDFNWNLNNLEQIIDETLDNYADKIQIAHNAQEKYQYYVNSQGGFEEFAKRFGNIVTLEI